MENENKHEQIKDYWILKYVLIDLRKTGKPRFLPGARNRHQSEPEPVEPERGTEPVEPEPNRKKSLFWHHWAFPGSYGREN